MNAANDLKLQVFSNQYYQFVDRFVKTDFENSKVLGKFYTDYLVAEEMITNLLSLIDTEKSEVISIIDPFCGDGRLLKIILLQLAEMPKFQDKHIRIVLWDIDEQAVNGASAILQEVAAMANIEVSIEAECVDAFVMYSDFEGTFDICITNPPWGLLKPQKLFNDRCSKAEIEEYKQSIAIYDDYMKSEFPLSQPTKKFGRWGTNLGRIGTEVALRLIHTNGLCGLVSPASLFNDQVSVPLRKWIFDEHKIHSISYYPAELKLYGTADVSSITAVIGMGRTDSSVMIKIYDGNRQFTYRNLSNTDLDYVRRNLYALSLESGSDTINILQKLERMMTVQDYCDKYGLYFTRELDETRVSEKLVSEGKIAFAKGYMVDRYSYTPAGLFLNEEMITPPDSSFSWKLVWRDVSRNSQKRRMKATILEPGHIAGNSLGVICCRKEEDKKHLYILLALMNSMVFEFQARSQLVSNHVSAGIIKQLHVPDIMANEKLLNWVCNSINGEQHETEIEVEVCKLYGLTVEEIRSIVSRFDLSPDEEMCFDEILRVGEEDE